MQRKAESGKVGGNRSAAPRRRGSAAARAQPSGRGGPVAKRPRILVVEDHLDSRDALRTLLEAFGFEVLEASDGRQALDVAAAESPDLILMDIMMPELDGFEATRLLRQRGATHEVPIIAVTAMEGAQRLALAAGANDFVPKPVDTRSLLEKIRSWLPRDAHESGNSGGNGLANGRG